MTEPAANGAPDAEAPQPARPDVFVSYARTDASFVRVLVEALESRGEDIWVDWDDIPKGSDWWTRIESGIESARTVIAVVTPAFAASGTCEREVAHAAAHNKRVIPVVRVDTQPGSLPAPVSARDWILMRAADDFDRAFDELLNAVNTDLEWLDEHARLLVRAREWESNNRDGSYLLRGRELRVADEWLAAQAGHAETATPLQIEYVRNAKRSSVRRQRITFAAVTTALLVSLALTGAALWQWQRAVERQKLARSRELAAQAESSRPTDLGRSLLLAVWRPRPRPRRISRALPSRR